MWDSNFLGCVVSEASSEYDNTLEGRGTEGLFDKFPDGFFNMTRELVEAFFYSFGEGCIGDS